jgi:hypothetical protein
VLRYHKTSWLEIPHRFVTLLPAGASYMRHPKPFGHVHISSRSPEQSNQKQH